MRLVVPENRPGRLESELREILAKEPAGLIGVIPRPEFAGKDLAAVDDHKVGAARVFPSGDHIQNRGGAHDEPRLFEALALGGATRILACIHKSSGKCPAAPEGLIVAAHEQHAVRLQHDNAGCHLWVSEIYPPTIWAGRATVAEMKCRCQRRGAVRTITRVGHALAIHHCRRSSSKQE